VPLPLTFGGKPGYRARLPVSSCAQEYHRAFGEEGTSPKSKPTAGKVVGGEAREYFFFEKGESHPQHPRERFSQGIFLGSHGGAAAARWLLFQRTPTTGKVVGRGRTSFFVNAAGGGVPTATPEALAQLQQERASKRRAGGEDSRGEDSSRRRRGPQMDHQRIKNGGFSYPSPPPLSRHPPLRTLDTISSPLSLEDFRWR
jgi:hypothetical protein